MQNRVVNGLHRPSLPPLLPLPAASLVSFWCRNSPLFLLGLDEGLGLAAVVDLDVDLGVLFALVSEALEVTAVAQQVEGQAESHHAQHQQAHVHLRTAYGSRPTQ